MSRIIGAQPYGLPAEPTVQFCDFCHDTVYRTLLVRIGDGSVERPALVPGHGPGQIRTAGSYRKACPRCADIFKARLRESEWIQAMGRQVDAMVKAGASQRELDEYIEGYGLDRELVKGFGIPEVEVKFS